MSANTTPIFGLTPRVAQTGTFGTSANTNLDGSGTTFATLITAGAAGSRVDQCIITHLGSNVASVVRFFVDPTGSAGWKLIHEETVAINTVSQVAASVPVIWNCNLVLPASAKIGLTSGTAVTAGYNCTAVGADY